MSKKKSYMNKSNLLSEGIMTWTLEKLFKFFYKRPKLKGNKKFMKGIDSLNSGLKELESGLNDELKMKGFKDRVKMKPYKLKDFI